MRSLLPGTPLPRRIGRDALSRGFTLVELMITILVMATVMIVLMTILNAANKSKTQTTNLIESTESAAVALEMLTRDLRSAGYGADLDWVAAPQPPIAYIDSMQVLLNANFLPFPDDTIPRSPLAYNPAGAPTPFPLEGTTWTPPRKYRRGAELVRWTLDVNDDGAVNSTDIADINGVDALRTKNPTDYVLVRQVYGDSTGNAAGFNGGVMQRVALVQRPGGAVAPMFRVYFAGQSAPWDWSSGPVPASRLNEINKVEVTVVSASHKPDKNGNYAQTKLTSTVSSLRNTPNAGRTTYAVDGYVYNDLNENRSKDALEPGIPGAAVRLGAFSAQTSASGYFIFHVEAGTYTLRNVPPMGFGVFDTPDSFVVSVPPARTQSLADTALAGGPVTLLVYRDANGSAMYDAGDTPLQNILLTMNPGAGTAYTDVSGVATLFATVGGFTVTATLPDSFVAVTSNPVSGTMVDGGSASFQIGLAQTTVGTVQGRVFKDLNRNGTMDGGEVGVSNVWVGITPDNGVTVLGYQYTDGAGDYSITAPTNVPPSTRPYQVMIIVPGGFYGTTSTVLQPIWLTDGQVLTGKNFGILDYQIIQLTANRILSIASGDVVEKQGSDNGGNGARQDVDIVLGADTGATDNISVWFNQYDSDPLFTAIPSYTRDAPNSVLSIALDTLDTGTPKTRLDCVTGTKLAAGGNIFVWINQNAGGNTGYFPTASTRAYRTFDNGDVQSLQTADLAGLGIADSPDILAGTKSPTANQGTIELWMSNNAATPAFGRLEIYPNVGAIPGNKLGEVNCMALADLDGDGLKDLVVGTKTGDYTGQLMLLRNQGKISGTSRFLHAHTYDIAGIVTALVPVQVDYDGNTDVVIGVQTGVSTGELQEWTNKATGAALDFALSNTVAAPGLVLSLTAADLGGSPSRKDIGMGWRTDPSSYGGGVRIYSLDGGSLPGTGTDPSAGFISNMAPCLTPNNFNYGTQPALPPTPWLTDLAAGIKSSASSGLLVIFVR
jgi:prepilin-type N-terminal cleavage/methylation domain-containing protein